MSCADARELFTPLVDGALTEDERARLDAHLATCADCRGELERWQRTIALIRSAASHRAPAGFADRVLAAARPAPWPRRLARRLFVPVPVKVPLEAAALVIVALTAVLVYQRTPEQRRETARGVPAAQAPAPPVSSTPPGPPASSTAPVPPATSADRATPPPGPATAPALRAPREAPDRSTAATPPREPAAPAERRDAQEAETSGAESPTAPRVATRSAAPAQASPALAARLAVASRDDAERALAPLVARLGGGAVALRDDGATRVAEFALPVAAWPELARELGRLGAFEAAETPPAGAATVRVVLRITS